MKNHPKIHLYIRGNCGNQFFQYAFARQLQEKLDGELIINYSKVKADTMMLPESMNLLKEFNTVPYQYEEKIGYGGILFKVLKLIHYVGKLKTFDKRTYKFFLLCARILPFFGIYYFDAAFFSFKILKRKNIYVNGYFESPKYFSDIDEKIVTELTPKKPLLKQNIELFNIIKNSESVCVTIKRMDVNNEDISDIYQYDLSYFYNAIAYICSKIKNPVFIIFSDDIEWCQKNLRINGEIYYETPNNTIYEKIRLMSGCKHFIIHNSTFSWWAQHLSLNKNKIVIAPSKWMQRDDQPIDIYEDGWIYLTQQGEIVREHE